MSVERGEGAADCPDAVALTEKVKAVRGAGALGEVRYTVRFAREGDTYATEIRRDTREGGGEESVRHIEDRGPDCAALAQATAVTLALLYDADAPRTPSLDMQAMLQAPPPPPPPPTPKPAPLLAQPEPKVYAVGVALGTGILIGTLRTFAPALIAEGTLVLPEWRFVLGAIFVPPQHVDLGPGEVTTTLLSSDARVCFAPLHAGALRFDLCTGFWLGSLHGEADGFTRNDAGSSLFTALPLEIAFARIGKHVGLEVGGGVLIPFRRPQFAIDGAGTAYDSPAVAGMMVVRGFGLVPW